MNGFIDTKGWSKEKKIDCLTKHNYGGNKDQMLKNLDQRDVYTCLHICSGVAVGYDSRKYYTAQGYIEITDYNLIFTNKSNTVLIKGHIETNVKCKVLRAFLLNDLLSCNHKVIETESGSIYFCNDQNLGPIVPPIKIDNHIVEFTDEGIKVGCTFVDKEQIMEIAKRFAEVRSNE